MSKVTPEWAKENLRNIQTFPNFSDWSIFTTKHNIWVILRFVGDKSQVYVGGSVLLENPTVNQVLTLQSILKGES